jgi:hypothetical protein
LQVPKLIQVGEFIACEHRVLVGVSGKLLFENAYLLALLPVDDMFSWPIPEMEHQPCLK